MAESVLAEAPESFALIGHSMGGRVALEVYRAAGPRIGVLALLDTASGPKAEGEEDRRMHLVKLAYEEGMHAVSREWLPTMVHPDRLSDRELMDALAQMIERNTPEQFEEQICALLNRPNATPLLAKIRCPALVLCGRQDTWRTPEQHAEMAELIPNVTLEIIEECGHMSTIERPEPVNCCLRDFLSRSY
jgi:pimeloyl-ACP methyl ester carboxylesterase